MERIHNDTIFLSLDHIHFMGLLFYGHILMDDAKTTFSSHGNGHGGFCHRIHAGADEWNVQSQCARQLCLHLYILWQHLRLVWYQQNVIKCVSSFQNFSHEDPPYSIKKAYPNSPW